MTGLDTLEMQGVGTKGAKVFLDKMSQGYELFEIKEVLVRIKGARVIIAPYARIKLIEVQPVIEMTLEKFKSFLWSNSRGWSRMGQIVHRLYPDTEKEREKIGAKLTYKNRENLWKDLLT